MAPAAKTLAQWLSYLESIHPTTIDMGLERVKQVAQRLTLDFSSTLVITVAGTNGKGTTCRFLEQALLAQGKSVGVYSSPHLLDYRERIRINNELCSEADYCRVFSVIEQAREDISLTYFEFGTLAAMVMMLEASVDVAILEVGLGGRLDATNILDPDIAVITTIGLDHQDWLGDTREQIAVEKAGIMRRGSKAIIGELHPPATLYEEVNRLEAKALWAQRDFSVVETDHGWQWQCGAAILTDLPAPQILKQNISTALATLHALQLMPDEQQLRSLIAETSLPGRRQRLSSAPEVIVDVAHNPQATAAMVEWLTTQSYNNLFCVVGMLKDKALEETLAVFTDVPAQWYLATTAGPRGCAANALKNALPPAHRTRTSCYDSVINAYVSCRDVAKPGDTILVFGSFLTVADVLAFHA
ncbi:bifunctional tetrahydrofolate synthase/dihydrofolate synthase [Alteromonas pelagimontana]|uniref:Dihydrofolate synthase/folylpolyglutamate synthase n=2 Tax=Alteromonas pelagimontana TaxID=1858656 RepID=A0A6N3IX50_9ALTE|nr:bifunctional tetrahydrofolate synthase/dihydrofolate synthase [Alteromonas pelagimontana]